jgi:hypothetical protein
LATGEGDLGPVAATWAVGEGRVVAAGFGAATADAMPFVRFAARSPRDPRLHVTWDVGPALRVSVDASTSDADSASAAFVNGLALSLELREAAGALAAAPVLSQPIPQTAPGRYELSVRAPDVPAIATLRRAGQAIDRVAVAGRYPEEFDRIGNNHRAMRDLAERTGGAVVEPSSTGTLAMELEARGLPLTSACAAAATACMAAGLIRWRMA